MTDFGLPILFALILWWASTGAIMYLDGLPSKTFKWSLAAATVLAGVCLYRLTVVSHQATVTAAYAAFAYGLLVWGWQTLTFYMGFIRGPRTTQCPPNLGPMERFSAAVGTSIYHEIACLIGAAVLFLIVRDSVNQIGLWTYVILWWMHMSGKLNVFFGVPNLAEEFIPDHLAYLRSYMRQRPMNLLFPLSVTVSTIITFKLAVLAYAAPAGSFDAAGYTFLATLMALAVLEHWFLVLPLPAMQLWQWSLKSRTPPHLPIKSGTPLDEPTH
jgi:putative photosynthetic complex assembly protein 2